MKLPNGDQGTIDVAGKLGGYCLNAEHARGRHKARVFEATLGITATDSERLVEALQDAAANGDAIFRKTNEYGDEYMIEFVMEADERSFVVTSSWFLDKGKGIPRLTNCYVNLKKS